MLRAFGLVVAFSLVLGEAVAQPKARFADAPPGPAPSATPRSAPVAQPPARRESWARVAARERVRRGQEQLGRGNAALALAELHEAVRMDPSFGEAYLAIGTLRERMGDPREAERTYEEAIRYPGSRAAGLAGRSRARRALGHMDEAIQDLQASVSLEPDRERLRLLADWYTERRAWPAALTTWRRLLSLLEGETTPERDEARLRVQALMLLAAESDPVSSGTSSGWVRSSLARISRR